jgi:PTS system fructose-specific IIA component/PTS system nitrogen regulatory IIA component
MMNATIHSLSRALHRAAAQGAKRRDVLHGKYNQQLRYPTDKGNQTMKFSDFICKEAVRTHLEAEEKEAAIRAMATSLVEAKQINAKDFESIVEAILKREELGSTGIGRGVAVPHTKHSSIDRLVGTVAISSEGVDFDSLDGEKVHLLFLLVSPPDRPGDHLRALENISRQLRDDTFCRFLKQSKSPQDVWQLLEEADNEQFTS